MKRLDSNLKIIDGWSDDLDNLTSPESTNLTAELKNAVSNCKAISLCHKMAGENHILKKIWQPVQPTSFELRRNAGDARRARKRKNIPLLLRVTRVAPQTLITVAGNYVTAFATL